MGLRFHLVLGDGQINNHVNNFSCMLDCNQLILKLASEVLRNLNPNDLYPLFTDLFLSEKERDRRIMEGIQHTNLNKLRSGAGNVAKAFHTLYGTKYRILLDYANLSDHGGFYPRALNQSLVFKTVLATASKVVVGNNSTKLEYELKNIKLEYEVTRSEKSAVSTKKKRL